MRKRVAQNLLATLLGALAGGIAVFWVLARVGSSPASPSPALIPVGTPTAPSPGTSPSPSSPSPTGTPVSDRVTIEALGIASALPKGYRLASVLNAYDAERSPNAPRLTITAATPAQEQEYVALLRTLQQKQAATEAPEFSPGKTITVARAVPSDQTYAEQVAKKKTTLTATNTLAVTRYERVEGLFPYDVAFATVRGALVSVSMSYASGGEKPFDEDAYRTVLRTLEAL